MRGVLLFFLLFFSARAAAQFPFVRVLEVRSGQRRPAVERIAQDGQGLIWAASDLGLLYTDGDRVEVVRSAEQGRIVALAPSTDGMLAMDAAGTLLRCHAWGCDIVLRDTSWRSRPVTTMIEDPAGNLWVGTYGAGLVRYVPGSTSGSKVTGLPDEHVNDLALLPDGRVVIATDQGIAIAREGKIEIVLGEDQGVPDNLVFSLDVDPEGVVWAGTDRSGVFQWRSAEPNARVEVLHPDWDMGPIRSVRVTGKMVWVATEGSGIIVLDRSVANGTYRSEPGPTRSMPKDMITDREGVVWWCDGTERLHRADPNILIVPEHEGLDLRGITALCSDGKGRIWFATSAGLFNHVAFFSEERRVTRLPINVDPATPIVSMAAMSDGTIWAATFGNGVYMIPPNGPVAHFTERDAPSLNNVLSARVVNDTVWFATLEGIVRRTVGGFVALVPEAGFVFDVLPTAKGVFLATDGRGVMRWKGGGWTGPQSANSSFYALVHDKQGGVWAAGPGTGFCRMDVDTAYCRGTENPPFDGELYCVGESSGRLFAFGSTGVLAFDPVSDALTDLTAAFGLEGATAPLNAASTDATGALWFACDKGLYRIRPTDAHLLGTVPTAIISVRMGEKNFPNGGPVRIAHDQNALHIQFAGFHYADPGAVRFEYRLIGLDEVPMRTRDREIGYSALPPGDYTFQVRAFVGEDPGDAAWVALDVHVDTPWWKRWWAVASGILLAGLIVLLLVRARDRRVRYRDKMEQEKVRFQLDALRSQVDPHFLFNSFNALMELIETDPNVAVEHVEQLSLFFRNILLVRDKERITVAEELRLLENYFALEQRRFGDAIELRIRVGDDALQQGIVPLTLQLLVENAVKHNVIGKGGPLSIQVMEEPGYIVVSNPIRARTSPARSTAFGLDSIVKRYSALTIQPVEVLRGTSEFSVRIPLIDPEP